MTIDRSFDRRRFLASIGIGAAGVAVLPALDTARALSIPRTPYPTPRPVMGGIVRLDKNENPLGPFASTRRAIIAAIDDANRYPGAAEAKLVSAIAKLHGVEETHVTMGCGSTEILMLCTERFTSAKRPLVSPQPTFETAAALAKQLERPVTGVPVKQKSLELDLDAMAKAARGAGLVYLCNPNNPTSTVHGAPAVKDFLARVRRESPETYILVDEAYHEYVDEPTYATMIPETQKDDHVIVARTFSKVFGMAGMRVGYAIATPKTSHELDDWRVDSGVNQLAAQAALVAIADKDAIRAEQQRNRDARAFVTKWFAGRGLSGAKSDANFVFYDIKRDVQPVIAACLTKGVAVGRPFPPLTTHLRVSIGTMPEMEKAVEVLGQVLG